MPQQLYHSVCVQQALREMFNIPANKAHRALDDCQVLQQIVPHLLALNGTPDLADLMDRDSSCSGTLGKISGGAGEPASHAFTMCLP